MMTGMSKWSGNCEGGGRAEFTAIFDETGAPEDSVSMQFGVGGNAADVVSVPRVHPNDSLCRPFVSGANQRPMTGYCTATWVPCPLHLLD